MNFRSNTPGFRGGSGFHDWTLAVDIFFGILGETNFSLGSFPNWVKSRRHIKRVGENDDQLCFRPPPQVACASRLNQLFLTLSSDNSSASLLGKFQSSWLSWSHWWQWSWWSWLCWSWWWCWWVWCRCTAQGTWGCSSRRTGWPLARCSTALAGRTAWEEGSFKAKLR